jgi:hypothetical protein
MAREIVSPTKMATDNPTKDQLTDLRRRHYVMDEETEQLLYKIQAIAQLMRDNACGLSESSIPGQFLMGITAIDDMAHEALTRSGSL